MCINPFAHHLPIHPESFPPIMPAFPHIRAPETHLAAAAVSGSVIFFIFPPFDDTSKTLLGRKSCFLELLPENIFDFMVLIIFLRNHSRIKHKDSEIFPLSAAPQWSSLVKKTTRSFFSPFSPLLFFTSRFFFFTTHLKKDAWGLEAVLCIYLESVAHM